MTGTTNIINFLLYTTITRPFSCERLVVVLARLDVLVPSWFGRVDSLGCRYKFALVVRECGSGPVSFI
jgi:hypothetical protein